MEDKNSLLTRLLKGRIIKDGHWFWNGAKDVGGYPTISYKDKPIHVSRLAAYLYLDLNLNNRNQLACHKDECDNRACWNPQHLYVGDAKSNALDASRFGRMTRYSTHCSNGHEYTVENTYIVPSTGNRNCRICKSAARKRSYITHGV